MRKPRHRPIRWPVYFQRQPRCHPARRQVEPDTAGHVHETTHVCPTCGWTFVEDDPLTDPPD